MNPLIWINDDDPSLGGDTPLEACLREAHEAGYAGIELGHKFPRRAHELRPLLGRHGLSLVSGWHSARLLERSARRELEALRPLLDLLDALGSRVLIFGEVSGAVHRSRRPLSERPTLTDASWDRLTSELSWLAQRVHERGIRLAFHHHMGTVVQSPDEVDRLMAHTPETVGLLVDTGHLAWADPGGKVGPCAFVERHASRIRHVHLKDVRRRVLRRVLRDDMPFLDAVVAGVFTVPGDGDLPIADAVASLRAVGYRGWLVVEAEQDPRVADPRTYARRGFANVSAWLRRPTRASRRRAGRRLRPERSPGPRTRNRAYPSEHPPAPGGEPV